MTNTGLCIRKKRQPALHCFHLLFICDHMRGSDRTFKPSRTPFHSNTLHPTKHTHLETNEMSTGIT